MMRYHVPRNGAIVRIAGAILKSIFNPCIEVTIAFALQSTPIES